MLENLPQYIANARKAIIQVATLIITIGTGIATYANLSDKWAGIITAVVGLAGTVLHYATPNAPAPGSGTAEDPYDITTLPPDDEEISPDWQPSELVTADQVGSSVPPESTQTAPEVPPAP